MGAEDVLTSNQYIDYTANEINIIASVIIGNIEEESDYTREEMLLAKKVLNTVLYTMLAEKDWCDEVIEEVGKTEQDALEEEVWNSLEDMS